VLRSTQPLYPHRQAGTAQFRFASYAPSALDDVPGIVQDRLPTPSIACGSKR
jgi:hypothetical protein